jgi:hypothetical protein
VRWLRQLSGVGLMVSRPEMDRPLNLLYITITLCMGPLAPKFRQPHIPSHLILGPHVLA